MLGSSAQMIKSSSDYLVMESALLKGQPGQRGPQGVLGGPATCQCEGDASSVSVK